MRLKACGVRRTACGLRRTAGGGLVLAAVIALSLGLASLVQAQPARKWPSRGMPRPLPSREVKFPPYELRTLPNGLQVVVVMHHEQPSVSMRLIVRAGSGQDPADTPGVAAMLSSMLDQGTTTMSALQVAEAIDGAGGQLKVGFGRDLSHAHVVVMKDGLSLGMNLLADVVRRPAFAGEELERQRKQVLSALQVSYQDPGYLANVVFDRIVYGSSPYGLPANGTPESVARITRQDLVAFHASYFVPNNCLLAVVGDVAVDEAMAAVTTAFGDWEKGELRPGNPPPPPDPARRVLVLDKPDAVQTEIRVGHLGIPRKSDDFMPVDLAIKILGGEGANRLHRVLRVERGLTYGASAETEALKRSGEFVAITNTRSDATAEALRVIADEYWRLKRDEVGERELEDAKAYLTGHFPLTIETPDDIAMQVLNTLFYELPLKELQTFKQRVNAITAEQVSRAAFGYLRPDRLSVVLVGNAAAFVEQLKGVGFGKYEVVRLPDLDVMAPDFKKKAPAPSSETVAALPALSGVLSSPPARALLSLLQPTVSAEALIKKAVDAKGGLDKLKSIKTVEATATTTVMLPQGPARTETVTYIEYPDHFRVEARLPTGTVVQVYGGPSNIWVQDPRRGVTDVPPQARGDFKASVDRDLIPLLVRAAAGDVKLRLLDADPKQQPGDEVRGVEVSGGGMEPVSLFIDTESGLVLRESYRLPAGGTAEESFSDYRDVSGLKVAFKASVRRNNLPVLERQLTDFKVNQPLKQGLFDRPKS